MSLSLPAIANAEAATNALDDAFLQSYVDSFPQVTMEQANFILSDDLNNEISEVQACLLNADAENYTDNFAGIYRRQAKKFRVMVKLKKRPNQSLRECTSNPVFKAVGAGSSLSELEDMQEAARDALAEVEFPFAANVDVIRNRVTIEVMPEDFTATKKALNRRRGSKKGIKVQRGDGFVTVTTAAVRAGLDVEGSSLSCTSGYTVFSTLINKFGITTAEHCGRSFRVNGRTQSVEGRLELAQNADVMWGTNSGDTYEASIDRRHDGAPGTTARVTGAKSALALNEWVCKIGRTTNRTCGQHKGLMEKKESFSCGFLGLSTCYRSTFLFQAEVPSATSPTDFTAGGDSGGPVFTRALGARGGITATGIVSGRTSSNGVMLYTGIDQFSRLSLSLVIDPN